MSIREYFDDMDIGNGFDPHRAKVKGTAIKPIKLRETFDAPIGQEAFAIMQQVSSYSDLAEATGLDASASVRFMGGGLSGKFALAKHCKVSSQSVNLLVWTRVRNQPQKMPLQDIYLLDSSIYQLYEEDPEGFVDQFGTEFICGYVGGGELFGLIQIQTSSASEADELKAQIGYKSLAFRGALEFKNALERSVGSHSMNLTMIRTGGQFQNPTDVTGMIKAFKEFPLLVAQEAAEGQRFFNVITHEYGELSHIPRRAHALNFAKRRNTLNRLGKYYLRYEELLSELDYVSQHQSDFKDATPAAIAAKRTSILEIQQKIIESVNDCQDAPINISSSACNWDATVISNPFDFEFFSRKDGKPAVLTNPPVMIRARDPEWQDTGVDVVARQPITIDATGIWLIGGHLGFVGPEGHSYSVRPDSRYGGPVLESARMGALIGRIVGADGTEKPFEVGGHIELYLAPIDGKLELMCNDCRNHPDGFKDNEGSVRATITLGSQLSEAAAMEIKKVRFEEIDSSLRATQELRKAFRKPASLG